jgi:hypothetical protein
LRESDLVPMVEYKVYHRKKTSQLFSGSIANGTKVGTNFIWFFDNFGEYFIDIAEHREFAINNILK